MRVINKVSDIALLELIHEDNFKFDFIYIDGPDQFKIKGKINGFSTKHKDLMPMLCDVLTLQGIISLGSVYSSALVSSKDVLS